MNLTWSAIILNFLVCLKEPCFFVLSEISSVLRYVTQMVVGIQQIMDVGLLMSY